MTRLDAGVFRVDRDDGPPWVARMSVTSRPRARTVRGRRGAPLPGAPASSPPNAAPTRDRSPTLGGRAVLVTGYVPGKRPPSDPGHPPQARRPARAGCTRCPPSPGPPSARRARCITCRSTRAVPARTSPRPRALLADLDGRVPDEHRQLYELIAGLLPEGDDCHGLPEAFLHPDPVRNNVIVTPDGPVLVDWTGAGRGPRLASLAALLHTAGPDTPAKSLTATGRHTDLTAEELDRLEGVLWIRPLWLAAWQCWLACVSAKVSQVFVPRPGRHRGAGRPGPGERNSR